MSTHRNHGSPRAIARGLRVKLGNSSPLAGGILEAAHGIEADTEADRGIGEVREIARQLARRPAQTVGVALARVADVGIVSDLGADRRTIGVRRRTTLGYGHAGGRAGRIAEEAGVVVAEVGNPGDTAAFFFGEARPVGGRGDDAGAVVTARNRHLLVRDLALSRYPFVGVGSRLTVLFEHAATPDGQSVALHHAGIAGGDQVGAIGALGVVVTSHTVVDIRHDVGALAVAALKGRRPVRVVLIRTVLIDKPAGSAALLAAAGQPESRPSALSVSCHP